MQGADYVSLLLLLRAAEKFLYELQTFRMSGMKVAAKFRCSPG